MRKIEITIIDPAKTLTIKGKISYLEIMNISKQIDIKPLEKLLQKMNTEIEEAGSKNWKERIMKISLMDDLNLNVTGEISYKVIDTNFEFNPILVLLQKLNDYLNELNPKNIVELPNNIL